MQLTVFSMLVLIAAGAFLFQGVQAVQYRSEGMNRSIAIGAIVAAVIGVVEFALSVGHPAMVFGAFSNLTSGITLFLYAAALFVVAAVVFLAMSLRSEDASVPAWCGVLAIVASVALMLGSAFGYLTISSGFKLSAIDGGSASIIAYFATDALLFGALVVLLIAALRKDEQATGLTRKALLVVAALNVVFVVAYLMWYAADTQSAAQVARSSFDIQHNSFTYGGAVATLTTSASDQLGTFLTGGSAPLFWVGVVVMGMVVPVAAGVAALLKSDRKVVLAVCAVALVAAVVGGVCFRIMLGAL